MSDILIIMSIMYIIVGVIMAILFCFYMRTDKFDHIKFKLSPLDKVKSFREEHKNWYYNSLLVLLCVSIIHIWPTVLMVIFLKYLFDKIMK